MQVKRVLEQHIAVFGESGSGKTVLLSSFYGSTQEPAYWRSSPYRVVADDIGQGSRLHKNYLDMRDSATRPAPDRFRSISYAFSVKLRAGDTQPTTASPFDALRLVWHDYPGEWFQEGVSGAEEAQRRVGTFRSLLTSDVAMLLVDGQELADNAGAEERYLKSVLGNFRNALLNLKDDLLPDGKPLVKFPRIWILALSKADLLPNMDVVKFQELLIKKALEELNELRAVLKSMVASSEALSLGEDFVLLSSAKFDSARIDLTQRVGIDLVLPIAAMLPFERHIKWVEEKKAGAEVAEELLSGLGAFAAVLIGKAKWGGLPGKVLAVIGAPVVSAAMTAAAKLAGNKLRTRHSEAIAKNDHMAAVLTGFQIALNDGEDQQVLLRSLK